MQNLTKEQEEDIKNREAKALEMLKELELSPQAVVYAVLIDPEQGIFGTKVIPYLQDTKFSKKEENKE